MTKPLQTSDVFCPRDLGEALRKAGDQVTNVEQQQAHPGQIRTVLRLLETVRQKLCERYPEQVVVGTHYINFTGATSRVWDRFDELGISTWEEASQYSEEELLKCGKFGKHSLAFVVEKLESIGLKLKGEQ